MAALTEDWDINNFSAALVKPLFSITLQKILSKLKVIIYPPLSFKSYINYTKEILTIQEIKIGNTLKNRNICTIVRSNFFNTLKNYNMSNRVNSI